MIPPVPRRGGVWVADLNPRQGTEPGKVRPVVVVQTDALNSYHTSTLICPLTTKTGRPENLLRVRLSKGEGGVARDSDVMLDQMCAMDNGRFRRRMGQIPGEKMEELRTKLVSLLDLV
jgi:mRNA interferase MazF